MEEERLKQGRTESAHVVSTSKDKGKRKRTEEPKNEAAKGLGQKKQNQGDNCFGCLSYRKPIDSERWIYVGDDIVGTGSPLVNDNLYLLDTVASYGESYCMSQSLDVFKTFKVEVENQLNKRIKCVRSDRGGEYYGIYDGSGDQRLGPFARYLEEYGIVPQYTMPRSPNMNGVAER
ncbi:uncharacterized protein [Glycine max]|uniref:uncharacterized protein n=1 Tax=Glycine max TaxID=3847 RepID=UPI000E21B741|nr:uncharacterized protein LOC113000209 [Glycine max]|eukprot:XP_025982670.1 uncharacterized protein LOC113000209 [Glycine max]